MSEGKSPDAPAAEKAARPPAKFGKPLNFGPTPKADVNGEKEGSCSAAVLWLHGFGDRPEGWASMFRPLRRVAPQDWRWVHLRAPNLPQPGYGGRSLPGWGQFCSSQIVRVGSPDYDNPDADGHARSCVAAVQQELERLQSEEEVPAERILIGGFSQGAATALEVVLTSKRPLAGCIALSGWLTSRARAALAGGICPKTSFLVCHGTEDDQVHFECGEAAAKALRDAGFEVQFERLEGVEHEACPQSLRALTQLLQDRLPSPCAASETPSSLQVPEWDGDELEDSDDSEDDGMDSAIYVCKATLAKLRGELAAGEVREETLRSLDNLKELPEDEVLVPVYWSAVASCCNIGLALRRKIPTKSIAEAFIKAADDLQATVATMPESERPSEITAGEWRSQAEQDSDDEEEEESGGDEIEEGDDDDEAPGGPQIKRPRMS